MKEPVFPEIPTSNPIGSYSIPTNRNATKPDLEVRLTEFWKKRKWWILGGLALFQLLVFSWSVYQLNHPAIEPNDLGRKEYANENLKSAEEQFIESASFGFRREKPLLNLGLTYAKMEDYEEAHRILENVMQSNRFFWEAYASDGHVLFEWGKKELENPECDTKQTEVLWNVAEKRFRYARLMAFFQLTTIPQGIELGQSYNQIQEYIAYLPQWRENCLNPPPPPSKDPQDNPDKSDDSDESDNPDPNDPNSTDPSNDPNSSNPPPGGGENDPSQKDPNQANPEKGDGDPKQGKPEQEEGDPNNGKPKPGEGDPNEDESKKGEGTPEPGDPEKKEKGMSELEKKREENRRNREEAKKELELEEDEKGNLDKARKRMGSGNSSKDYVRHKEEINIITTPKELEEAMKKAEW